MPEGAAVAIDGREIGRLLGPADWDSPEAAQLIRAAIAEGRSAATKKPL